MLYKKEGFPEVGELVICKVTRILEHSAFLELVEYKDKEGMIHISEVSSRFVKNIRDYLKENRLYVCKVLSVNKEKGHIDLSLKRVSRREEKEKLNEWKLNNRVEKILEFIAKKLNKTLEDAYKEVGFKIIDKFGELYRIIEEYKENEKILDELGISEDWKKLLEEELKEIAEKGKVRITKKFKLSCLEEDGVDRIKEVLSIQIPKGYEGKVIYLGSGSYMIELIGKEAKKVSKHLEKILKKMKEKAKKLKVNFVED